MDICASAAHLRVLVGLRAARDVHAVYRARLLHGKVKLIGVALLSLLAQLLQCAIGIGGSCIVKRRQSPKRGRLSAEQGGCNWGSGWLAASLHRCPHLERGLLLVEVLGAQQVVLLLLQQAQPATRRTAQRLQSDGRWVAGASRRRQWRQAAAASAGGRCGHACVSRRVCH